MKRSILMVAAAATAFMFPAAASAQSAYGEAYGSGFADGLVQRGQGGSITGGGSFALSRSDTDPAYGTGYATDQRFVGVGSQGRNGAQGDQFMESASRAEAGLDGATEEADAFAAGEGAYNADATGRDRYTGGLTIGTGRTEAFALEVPGRRGDEAVAEAEQTTVSAALSGAADRRNAAAASAASAVSRAEASATE